MEEDEEEENLVAAEEGRVWRMKSWWVEGGERNSSFSRPSI